MDITIAICTHNRAKLVCEAIESIYRYCERDNFHLLVIDNASQDNTQEELTRLTGTFDFEVIIEPVLGLSVARNTALKHTKTEYIIFLDDDGEVSEGWLDAFQSFVHKTENVGAAGGRIIARYAKKPPVWLTDEGLRFYGEYNLGNRVTKTTWAPGGNAIWDTQAVRDVGGFNPNLGRMGASPILGSEESAVAEKLLKNNYEIYYLPDALMYHKIGSEKLSLSWLTQRYFGQGVSAITIQKQKNSFETSIRRRNQFLASAKNVLKMSLRALWHFITIRYKTGMQTMMLVARYCGEIWAIKKIETAIHSSKKLDYKNDK